MLTPQINAVATATPSSRFTQARILELAGYADAFRRRFFTNSEIDGRYLYLDPNRVRAGESVDELNDRFCRGALALGEAAAGRALAQAGWTPAALDFLATTTCTGRMTPSLDAHLVARLGCRPDIQRVHVGDTGCASALVAVEQAWNHLAAFPTHRALVVAVEICSAAYFLDERLESAVAHAIFADGAGALALSTCGGRPGTRTPSRRDARGGSGCDGPRCPGRGQWRHPRRALQPRDGRGHDMLRAAGASLVILFLGACTTVPLGPSVMALPGTGKTFEQFQVDDAVCRQWAAQQTATTPARAWRGAR